MLDSGGSHIIKYLAAVIIDPIFGNNKQGYTAGSGFSSIYPGQEKVYDVFREVVVAVADKDLLAFDLVDPRVVGRIGLAVYLSDIGSGLGLGQAHGPGIIAGEHLGQEFLFDVFRGQFVNEHGRPLGHGQERRYKGRIGGGEHFPQGEHHHLRQNHRAFAGVIVAAAPALGDELFSIPGEPWAR